MSQRIVNEVHQRFPHLLQTNTGAACHQFTLHVIEHLRAAGHLAYLMVKTQGEGQYVPVGWQPRDVQGFDGKTYLCTGVSHDAIWCDGNQFDTIAGANEHDQFIYRKSSEPFWSFDPNDGPKITGVPVWNAVPPEHWRPNNPPLKSEPVVSPPPAPAPPPATRIPSYAELGDDIFFRQHVGVPLQADMALAGQPLNEGSSVWFSRTVYRLMAAALSGTPFDPAAEVRIVRNEWRQILGLPLL